MDLASGTSVLGAHGSRTIRAAISRGAGRPLSIETLEIGEARDNEVLVRIVASGICHTDIDCCEAGDQGGLGAR